MNHRSPGGRTRDTGVLAQECLICIEHAGECFDAVSTPVWVLKKVSLIASSRHACGSLGERFD
jgi:hypothetical protein